MKPRPTLRLQDPVVLTSLVLLLVNDHLIKASPYAGWVSGKLSDFAGLFFFPFFIYDIYRYAWRREEDQTVLRGIVLITALGFTLLKTSAMFNEVFVGLYAALGSSARVVMDPSDLSALIMLPLVLVWERKRFLAKKDRL